jgi:ADP-heptose:LPS heptosyltransferase
MKILIVQIGRIGDMVLTTPMFRAIGNHLPDAEIHVLTSPRSLSVIFNNPRIVKIHLYRKNFLLLPQLMTQLRGQHYDVWIDPKDHPSSEGSLLASFSGAQQKIGFNKPGQRVFDVALPSAEANCELHVSDRNLCALSSLIPVDSSHLNRRPELFVDPDYAVPLAPHTVLINISAGNPSRHWPVERWGAVIAECTRLSLPVALMFDPTDRAAAKEIAARGGNCLLLDTPTIHHAIAAVSSAALVISPDTSVVHIAAAFNVPIIALYPCVDWNLKKFYPLSDQAAVILPDESQTFQDIPDENVIKQLHLFVADLTDFTDCTDC